MEKEKSFTQVIVICMNCFCFYFYTHLPWLGHPLRWPFGHTTFSFPHPRLIPDPTGRDTQRGGSGSEKSGQTHLAFFDGCIVFLFLSFGLGCLTLVLCAWREDMCGVLGGGRDLSG